MDRSGGGLAGHGGAAVISSAISRSLLPGGTKLLRYQPAGACTHRMVRQSVGGKTMDTVAICDMEPIAIEAAAKPRGR